MGLPFSERRGSFRRSRWGFFLMGEVGGWQGEGVADWTATQI